MKQRRWGFTLVELMIVIVIIAIVLAIAIPRFSRIVLKSREASTKGNLGSIRGALSVYYGEVEGLYPTDDLSCLMIGAHFIPIMPPALLPATSTNTGHQGAFPGVIAGAIPAAVTDVGDNYSGWLYDNGPADSFYGRVIVNCSHSDIYGDPWTSF